MLNDEIIEKLTNRIVERLQQANTYILKQIGIKIKAIKDLNYTEAQQLAQILKYGGDYEKITKKLSQITNLNVKEIKEIFEEVAKKDYEFAKKFYDYRKIKFIPYEKNRSLQNQINAISNIVSKRYAKMMNPKILGYGFVEDGKISFKGLKKTYYDLLDEAVLNVSQGKETFDMAMSKQIKQMGGSGLKVIYETTYIDKNGEERNITRRLDSSVRMNLKDSLRELHNEIQDIVGKEFGADGVEISVHENPAPDHEEVQGKQFSMKQFENFQNDKKATSYDGIEFEPEIDGKDRRAISEYNCYHYIFNIVLGVSKPTYSNKQLKEIINNNNKGFDLDGKHYTNYEGTQLQRKLETEIRNQKDIQILAVASDNQETIMESQKRIKELTYKYKELSKVSNLKEKPKRMKVSGYRRRKAN